MKPTWLPGMSLQGKDLGYTEDVEVFPSQISEAYPSPDWQSGYRQFIMQKDDSVQQNSRAFWLFGASQHPQPPRNEPHLSALILLPPFPMLDERTLHYAPTVLPAFAGNVFMAGVRFSFECPLYNTTIGPLATLRPELGTPIRTDELIDRSYAGTAFEN